jgi:prepilin-type N-terminal cleavage/methylation domain-containing protein
MKTKRSNTSEYIRSTKGFTMIELVISLAIMSLLVSTCITLFTAGQRTYQSIYDDYQLQSEARIAISYLDVKIRQNDCMAISGNRHSVRVVEDVATSKYYLEVEGDTSSEYIYDDGNGTLRVTDDLSKIFDIDQTMIAGGFDSISISSPEIAPGEIDPSIINIEIEYNGSKRTSKSIILRSDVS